MTVQTKPDVFKNDRSAALFERAQAVMPSGYTRQMVVTKPHPQYGEAGDGCWITDVDGNRRIDFVNNFGSLIHGHDFEPVTKVITAQASRLLSAILPTEWEIKLAELLCDRYPSMEQVRFMNTGTEAVMIGVKAARAYTGKPMIAKMEGGYHGQYDLMEVSFRPTPPAWGDAKTPAAVENSPGTPQSLLDEVLVLPLNDIEAARDLIRAHADKLAAVLIDPFRLQWGLVAPEKPFLEMLREETERLGIVLIFDEVFCLRTGYHGTQGLLGITPDMTVTGKIIGGGLPIGALGGKTRFMDVFSLKDGDPKVKHSGTFTANPMSTAAGYAAMAAMTPEAFDKLTAVNDRLREGLAKIVKDLDLGWCVEGTGSLSALWFADRPARNYRALAMLAAQGMLQKMDVLQKLYMEEGIISLRGGFIGSTPMTADDIDVTLAGVRRALTRMKAM